MMVIIIIFRFLCFFIINQSSQCYFIPAIAPKFIESTTIRSKLYYNNRGVRLDCITDGNPQTTTGWFHRQSLDDPRWMKVEKSDLIETFLNGSLYIRPFQSYFKSIHSGQFSCRAENGAGSIQTLPITIKPQIYETFEIEVKTPYGFEQSSIILTCDISPFSARSYLKVIGWYEKLHDRSVILDLRARSKWNLLSNGNLIIHNLTKSDDQRNYSCLVENQIDQQTRQSPYKALRVRGKSPFGPELLIANNTEYHAWSDDLIEIPCGIGSLPTTTKISWWKNGQRLTSSNNDYSLIFHVQLNDSGIYLCRVDDDFHGQMSTTSLLRVFVKQQCQINIENVTADVGSYVNLTCSTNRIHHIQAGQWQWFHNSIDLDIHDRHYSINNISRRHMGIYRCCSIDESNSCCAQAQIRVINAGPIIVVDDNTNRNPVMIVQNNETIQLNFTFYGDPIPSINLYKDGHEISTNNSMIDILPTGDVRIHYRFKLETLNQTGLYECRAQNSFGSKSVMNSVHLRRQKPFISPMENRTIAIGDTLILICYASGQPHLHLQWIDETTNRIVQSSIYSPLVFKTNERFSKSFRCRAKNLHGESSHQVFVHVQRPVKIVDVSSNQTVRVGVQAFLYCSVEGDPPLMLSIRSLSNQRQRIWNENSEHFRRISSLRINSVEMSDNGLFECTASNDQSSTSVTFQLAVQNVPDRIDRISIDHFDKIHWNKPFDGNSPISQYILRFRVKSNIDEDFSWSDETIIEHNETFYLMDNFLVPCRISLRVQAKNQIGFSIPSEPIEFDTNIPNAIILYRKIPFDLRLINISSQTASIAWKYPYFPYCNNGSLEFLIELIDHDDSMSSRTYRQSSTSIYLSELTSFNTYTILVYAQTKFGRGPSSEPFVIRTLETVPLVLVDGLSGTLLNNSTLHVSWTMKPIDQHLLNGRFHRFSVQIYRNHNMSTLMNLYTNQTDLILEDLFPSSHYFISISVCNSYDCGPSSPVMIIETPIAASEPLVNIFHPVTKSLSFTCASILENVTIPRQSSSFVRKYNCGSKHFQLHFFDKPSSIRATIFYSTWNEIGLRLNYASDIVESLSITYKLVDQHRIEELIFSPAKFDVRLTNLSCGSRYQVMIYASNQAGFSSTEMLIGRTDGSVPTSNNSKSIIEFLSNDSVTIDLDHWIIHRCSIISYEISIWAMNENQTIEQLVRYFLVNDQRRKVYVNRLEPNHSYEINFKIISQAGENRRSLIFRTKSFNESSLNKDDSMILLAVIVGSCFITFMFSLSVVIFLRRIRSSCRTFQSRSNSYESEDSNGNISPYAVAHFTTNASKFNTNIRDEYILTKNGTILLMKSNHSPSQQTSIV